MPDFLAIKGIYSNSNLACIFSGSVGESPVHSLLICRYLDLVWKEMVEWIGFGRL